jgi:phage major head subunit gpT-like protein
MGLHDLASRAVQGAFYDRMAQSIAESWLPSVAWFNRHSNQASEEYPMTGHVGPLEPDRGEGEASHPPVQRITVVNARFRRNLEIPRPDFRRDKTGQIAARIGELAVKAGASHWSKLITDAMVAAESTVGYDGQYFFDTDHADPGAAYQTAQSNDITADISTYPVTHAGTTTSPSPAEAAHAIWDAIQQLYGLKDNEGEPTNEDALAFTVITGVNPIYKAVAAAVSGMFIDGGNDNPLLKQRFVVQAYASPRLTTWTEKFAVFASHGTTRAFIAQEEKGSPWLEELGPSSEHAIRTDRALYIARASRNVAYGEWRKACLVTLV